MKIKKMLFFLTFLVIGVFVLRIFDESFGKTPITIIIVGLVSGVVGLKVQSFLQNKSKSE